MRTFIALISARNKEFYRDKASLTWAILFPLLLIVGFSFAFSRPADTLFTLGVIGDLPDTITTADYIEVIPYEDDKLALKRIRHHQLDILINTETHTEIQGAYNKLSPSSTALLDILYAQQSIDIRFNNIEGKAVRYVEWALPGVLGMNIMFAALFGVGYVIVRYRKNGVLKRLSASPVSPIHFLAAQMISRFIIVIITCTSIMVGCILLLDLKMEGNWLLLIATMAIGCITMICMSLVIASRTASEELASGMLNLLTWPMMVLSELWFSLDNAPQWMQSLSNLIPLTHMVKTMRNIMIDGAGLQEVFGSLIILVVVAVISILLGAKLFKWEVAS